MLQTNTRERIASAEAKAAEMGLTIVRDPIQCELRRNGSFVIGLPTHPTLGIDLTVALLVDSLLRELGRPSPGRGNA